MTAQELEDRIIAAEKASALIRPLVVDFKAYKDSQLSDLTGLVNAADAAAKTATDSAASLQTQLEASAEQLAAANKERDEAIRKCAATEAKLRDPDSAKEDALEEADKEARQHEIDELTKQRDAEAARLAEIEAKIAELSK